MPIKDKSIYPPDWLEIRKRILEREENRCKICRAINYDYVFRGLYNGIECYQYSNGRVYRTDNGSFLAEGFDINIQPITGNLNRKAVRIVLTIAHLDHDPTNNSDDNLAALCQLHHLRHDSKQHRTNAAETRMQKKGLQKLF